MGTSHLASKGKGVILGIQKTAGGSLGPDGWLLNKQVPEKKRNQQQTIDDNLPRGQHCIFSFQKVWEWLCLVWKCWGTSGENFQAI